MKTEERVRLVFFRLPRIYGLDGLWLLVGLISGGHIRLCCRQLLSNICSAAVASRLKLALRILRTEKTNAWLLQTVLGAECAVLYLCLGRHKFIFYLQTVKWMGARRHIPEQKMIPPDPVLIWYRYSQPADVECSDRNCLGNQIWWVLRLAQLLNITAFAYELDFCIEADCDERDTKDDEDEVVTLQGSSCNQDVHATVIFWRRLTCILSLVSEWIYWFISQSLLG